VNNVGGDLKKCPEVIQLRMVWHLWHCDEDYGRRVAQIAGIDLEKAKALQPLPGKPAPHANRQGSTYTSGQSEQGGSAQKEPSTSEEVAAK
jgi:catalase